MRGPRRGQRALLVAALLWVPPASLHPACLRPTHAHARTPLQELLDCLDLLLAVEKVEDVRAHLGPILARKQAGLLASFTQVSAGQRAPGGPPSGGRAAALLGRRRRGRNSARLTRCGHVCLPSLEPSLGRPCLLPHPQAVGNLGNMLSGGRATPSDTS